MTPYQKSHTKNSSPPPEEYPANAGGGGFSISFHILLPPRRFAPPLQRMGTWNMTPYQKSHTKNSSPPRYKHSKYFDRNARLRTSPSL